MPVVRFDKDHLVTSSEEMDRAVLEGQREGISIAEVERMLQRPV